MTRQAWLNLTLTCGLVAMVGAPATTHAADAKDDKTLHFETAYSEQPILDSARTITFQAKFNRKGSGRGSLSLDPNRRKGQLSTAIAVKYVKVTLKKIEDEKHGKEGRQVYVLGGKGLENLRVAVPEKGDGPSFLLIVGNDGKEKVVEMRRKESLFAPRTSPVADGG